MEEFIVWLRRHRIGTIVKLRDFLLHLTGVCGVTPLSATLSIRIFRRDGSVEDRGIVSIHQVTDDFVGLLVDTLQGLGSDWDAFKYHDSGEDNTAEDATDSVLGSPCGDSRDAGTQTEGATANIYKSAATHTYAGTYTIVEHGLFNASANGILMDRSVFTAVGVESGDKIEFTYQLTCTSGG